MYRDHIKRINIYSEAAGAFDSYALSESELESYMNFIGDENPEEPEEIDPAFESTDVEGEVLRIKKEAAQNAERFVKDNLIPGAYGHQAPKPEDEDTASEKAGAGATKTDGKKDAPEENRLRAVDADEDLFNDYSGSPEDMAGVAGEEDTVGNEYPEEESSADASGDADEAADGSGNAAPSDTLEYDPDEMTYNGEDDLVMDDEDEFQSGGETAGVVDEFEGPVSLNNVFGTLDSYRDADFESVYGEEGKTLSDIEAEEAEAAKAEEILERRRHADDDSNEFYDEDDAEYDPEMIPDEPTSEIIPVSKGKQAQSSKKKKRKKKRSMSITDEFKAVRDENDN